VLEPATLLRSSVTLPSTVPAAFQVNANPGNWSQHDVRRSGVRVTLSILWRDAKGRQFRGIWPFYQAALWTFGGRLR
jgi:hypothetical protein